jgi:hypothetical protein
MVCQHCCAIQSFCVAFTFVTKDSGIIEQIRVAASRTTHDIRMADTTRYEFHEQFIILYLSCRDFLHLPALVSQRVASHYGLASPSLLFFGHFRASRRSNSVGSIARGWKDIIKRSRRRHVRFASFDI